jgi:hypothetical protein
LQSAFGSPSLIAFCEQVEAILGAALAARISGTRRFFTPAIVSGLVHPVEARSAILFREVIMRRFIWSLALVAALVLSSRGTAQAQVKKVLMFCDVNAAWHQDSEVALADYLETVGYSVTIQHIGDMNQDGEAQKALAKQHDVVYLGDSIGSVTVSQGDFEGSEFFLGALDVPIISQEAYMFDEGLFAGRDRFTDFGDTFQALEEGVLGAFEQAKIAAEGHPMAAGLVGNVNVYTDPYGYNFGYLPSMGKGAKAITTVPGKPEYATLFLYEKGSELYGGTRAAGMRIGMFIGQNVAREEFGGDGTNNRFDRLTADGRKLVKAAFDYATGKLAAVAGDFDGDGQLTAKDIDLLSTEARKGTNSASFDLNNDKLVNNGDREVWVNSLRKTYFGDSNLDGQFNSTDFVSVFQSGQYEDATAGNSTWATGDWNGDAEFSSSDFVTAFQAGGYEAGPRAAVSAVPEPATGVLMLLGALPLMRRRR